MRVALIGASGFVGSAVLQELIHRGHEVTAIVRHPSRVRSGEGVQAVAADVTDVAALAEILKGQDAVISAYNGGWENPNIYADHLAGSRSIQEAVQQSGVKRLIVVGGAGSLYSKDGVQLVDTPEFPEFIKAGATAARDYLDLLKQEQQLEWTFFSPAIEMHPGTSGERRGTYRTGTEYPVFDSNGKSILSVEDTAVVLADELEKPTFIRKRFTAAY